MMTRSSPHSPYLLNRPIIMVFGAQFFSALADNALFFSLLEYLATQGQAQYNTYILQGSFFIFYITLAPFVGYFADRKPKGQVLIWGNSIKIIGVLSLFLNSHPFLSYAMVGFGAAVYSPAKFGILTELVEDRLLIKANALIEGSTILAILLGAYLGGLLSTQFGMILALLAVTIFYSLALFFNFLIPRLPPQLSKSRPLSRLLIQFKIILLRLLASPRARFAILGTSLFWAAATTLRLLLNEWVRVHLQAGTDTVALFNIIISIGVVIGAGLASYLITIKTLHRALWAGVIMGGATVLFSFQSSPLFLYPLLILTGISGGLYVIPLNALLQKSGYELNGVGQAVAIQNFSESSTTLLMMFLFIGLSYLELSVTLLMIGFGFLFCTLMGVLSYFARQWGLFN